MDRRHYSLTELRSIPYEQYLRTWHWHNVRYLALRRAGYRCAECGAVPSHEEELDVHHKAGYACRGQETPDDVVVLCRACHRSLHPDWKDTRPSRAGRLEDASLLADRYQRDLERDWSSAIDTAEDDLDDALAGGAEWRDDGSADGLGDRRDMQ